MHHLQTNNKVLFKPQRILTPTLLYNVIRFLSWMFSGWTISVSWIAIENFFPLLPLRKKSKIKVWVQSICSHFWHIDDVNNPYQWLIHQYWFWNSYGAGAGSKGLRDVIFSDLSGIISYKRIFNDYLLNRRRTSSKGAKHFLFTSVSLKYAG